MAVTEEDSEDQTILEKVSNAVRMEAMLTDMVKVAYPLDGGRWLAGTSCCWSAVKTIAPDGNISYKRIPKGTNVLLLMLRKVGPI